MKKLIYFAIGVATMLMVASCEKDGFNGNSGEGGFSLALNVNNELASTRATNADDLIQSAQVKIYMPNFSGLIRQYTYKDMDEVVYLPSGNGYRVDVIAGEAVATSPRKANFDQKSYKGSADFNIIANQITNNVKVVAKISNAVTNVTFDETIATNFSAYTLKFALADLTKSDAPVAEGDMLVYGKATADAEGKSGEGYFIVDDPVLENKLYWLFEGTKNDGTAFTAKGEIEAPSTTDDNSLVGTRHNMTFKYIVKDGKLTFTLVVDEQTTTITDKITWVPTSTGLSTPKAVDIWAKFVTIGGDVDTKEYDGNPETPDVFDAEVYVQYRVKADTEWAAPTAVTEDMVKVTTIEKGSFSQVINGLEPATEYQCRMVINKINMPTETEGVTTNEFVVINGDKVFTTAVAQQVPNRSFEENYSTGSYDIFNPQGGYGFVTTVSAVSDSVGKDHTWWGTGNQVQLGQTVDVTTVYEGDDIPNKSDMNKFAVCMKSRVVLSVKLAAGNIYSGYFNELYGTDGGSVHFGRNKDVDGEDFVSRPTGVSFYVKYESTKVTKANGGGLNEGDMDEGQIKFAVGNWDYKKNGNGGSKECPIAIDTRDSGDNPLPSQWNLKTHTGTIAYCDKIFTSNDNSWKKVTLKFDYNNLNQIPTHIIISAASSRLGDYFTGGNGSTMYLDDIELLYDYGVEDKVEQVK